MHDNNRYPSDKSLSNIYDPFLPSPSPPPSSATATCPCPSSPAPAYTTLPDREVDFHLAPIFEGKVGDVELETVDNKRFLVHRKVLETETVFFHIYYGFVPVWRLNAAGQSNLSIPITQQTAHQAHCQTQTQAQANRSSLASTSSSHPLNNLLCLPKILASTLSRLPPLPSSAAVPTSNSTTGPGSDGAVPSYEDSPPPPPPKDVVTAPTPTSSPYTWAVPETSVVLAAFLSLIYPRGCIVSHTDDLLSSLELTGRVVRAALGYQSTKALALARDRLGAWMEDQAVQTYAMATFFKFTDLARLASMHAVRIPYDSWPEDSKVLMGRTGSAKLLDLQARRTAALRQILSGSMEVDAHSATCKGSAVTEEMWGSMTAQLAGRVGAESELLELLEVDLRGGCCGDCLVLLGRSIQRCLYEARDLPRTI